jgi:hypothetical protein
MGMGWEQIECCLNVVEVSPGSDQHGKSLDLTWELEDFGHGV